MCKEWEESGELGGREESVDRVGGNAILQIPPRGWLRRLPFKGGHCQGNVSEVAELRRQMAGFFIYR